MTEEARPVAWHQQWRTIKHMRSIALKADERGLYDLTEKAANAVSAEDDLAFLAAVGKFFEHWDNSRR